MRDGGGELGVVVGEIGEALIDEHQPSVGHRAGLVLWLNAKVAGAAGKGGQAHEPSRLDMQLEWRIGGPRRKLRFDRRDPRERMVAFAVGNGGKVDRLDRIADPQPGGGRGRAHEDLTDVRGGRGRLPEAHGEVDDHREDEVGDRSRQNHQRTLPDGFGHERATHLVLVDRLQVAEVVAEHEYVTAQRQRADHVLGLSVGEPEDLGPEPDREPQDLDVAHLGDGEVSELVEEHERADHDDEVDEGHGRPGASRGVSPARTPACETTREQGGVVSARIAARAARRV